MLRLDLGRLGREGSVEVKARVPADAPLWKDSGVKWAEPVEVQLTASYAGTGEVVVRGAVGGTLEQQCRRCLKDVRGTVKHDVTMVFASADTPGVEDDVGVHVYGLEAELDLSKAVREEIVLAVDPYVVCDSECKGLCPQCGVDWNFQECDCEVDEADPRWEALRALKEK